MEGVSFKNTFLNQDAEGKKKVQYFEMRGNRSIYKDGWKAVVNHMFHQSFDEDEWELYHVEEDYSEKYNVADKYPKKLQELQEEWLIEAGKYGVFPMIDNGALSSRDGWKKFNDLFTIPISHLEYDDILFPYDLIKDPGIGTRTGTITFKLNRKNTSEEGVLLGKGDRFGGVSIYIKENHINYVYNVDADTYYVIESDKELPLGEIDIRSEFIVTGEEQADVRLYVGEELVGFTRIDQFIYTISEGAPVCLRINRGSSIYDSGYQAPFSYKGEVRKVIFDFPESVGHKESELLKELVHD